MSTGLRVKDMDFASKLVVAAMILHNLCIKFGDQEDETELPEEAHHDEGQADAEVARGRERRRNQLLIFFQRN